MGIYVSTCIQRKLICISSNTSFLPLPMFHYSIAKNRLSDHLFLERFSVSLYINFVCVCLFCGLVIQHGLQFRAICGYFFLLGNIFCEKRAEWQYFPFFFSCRPSLRERLRWNSSESK